MYISVKCVVERDDNTMTKGNKFKYVDVGS